MERAVSSGDRYRKEVAVKFTTREVKTTVFPDGLTSLLSKTVDIVCMIQDVVARVGGVRALSVVVCWRILEVRPGCRAGEVHQCVAWQLLVWVLGGGNRTVLVLDGRINGLNVDASGIGSA
jgi:hypothetical protein